MQATPRFSKTSPCAEEVDLHLLFKLDGTNTPTYAGPSAWASNFVSIARSSAGKYLITLRDKFVSLKGAYASVKAATAVDLVPQWRADDVSGAKTVTVALLTGATETDPPAAASNATYLAVHLVLQGSTSKAV